MSEECDKDMPVRSFEWTDHQSFYCIIMLYINVCKTTSMAISSLYLSFISPAPPHLITFRWMACLRPVSNIDSAAEAKPKL